MKRGVRREFWELQRKDEPSRVKRGGLFWLYFGCREILLLRQEATPVFWQSALPVVPEKS